MWLDQVLSAFAVAQAVLATLRAGSKVLVLTGDDHDSAVLDLPLILPSTSERSGQHHVLLFDLTTAFRQGVKLGLNLDEYENSNNGESYQIIVEEKDETAADVEPYLMSLVPVPLETTTTNQEQQPLLIAGDDDDESRIEDQKYDEKDESKPQGNNKLTCNKEPRVSRKTEKEPHSRWDFDESWVTEYALAPNKMARIRAYSPHTFSVLRSYYGIPDNMFREMVLETGPFCSFQSNSKGAARTGGVFFLTRDGSFLIKTVKRTEMRTVQQMMPKYVDFMKENGRRTLLNRFCGMYEVNLRDGDKEERHYFVIMNSVFPRGANKRISERFDLKGSTVGRKASAEERETLGPKAVLKDLDLAQEVQGVAVVQGHNDDDDDDTSDPHYGLHIGPSAKSALLSQLRMDVGLLQDCSVIDYSLLVGVAIDASDDRNRPTSRKVWSAVRSAIRMAATSRIASLIVGSRQKCTFDAWGQLSILPGERKGRPAIYYFGLIDFLQPFDYKKDLEYRLKGLVYKKATYSCVPPGLYAHRFLDFVDKHVT